MFREFVVRAASHSGRRAADAIAAVVAGGCDRDLGRDGLARCCHSAGRPPLTRFAYWVTSQECTIRIDKAREQLGYQPVKSRDEGLAELREG